VAADEAGNTIVGHGPSPALIKRILSRQLRPPSSQTIATLYTQHYAWVPFDPATAGLLTIRWYSVSSAHTNRHETLIAAGSRTLSTGQQARIVLTITQQGNKSLKRHRPLKIVTQATFTPVGAQPITLATAPSQIRTDQLPTSR
jgi:hypothetical protein